MKIETDLGTSSLIDAKRIPYQTVSPLTSTNVEDAINQVQANVTTAGSNPPSITPTSVNFAMSPYAVQSTDYILEVDTSGGVVQIVPQAVGSRGKVPLTVKDLTGNAQANNIQITGPIEGQNPLLVDSNYGAVTIRPNKAASAYEVVTW